MKHPSANATRMNEGEKDSSMVKGQNERVMELVEAARSNARLCIGDFLLHFFMKYP